MIQASERDPIRNEARLAAVLASQLLDTPPEESFDFYTRMAAKLVHAPFAFVTVVDESRSYWKSTYGLPPHAPRENTVEQSFCQYVVRSGKEFIVGDSRLHELTKTNPSVDDMGVLAWAGFPVTAPDQEIIGTFCAVDTQPRVWTQHEIDILESLALAASREIALRFALQEGLRDKEAALATVGVLQASLLPTSLPDTPDLDIGASFLAAGDGGELMGDFYEIYRNMGKSISFLVGDVCGKGIEAAKLATYARHVVSSSATHGASAQHVLEQLNRTILARQHEFNRYLTAVYGVIDEVDSRYVLRLACAGHVPPLIQKRDGTVTSVSGQGLMVGVFDDCTLEEIELKLERGDTIILYTDGVTEARRGDLFYGDDRLSQLVVSHKHLETTAQELTELIKNDVVAFSNGVVRDDVAIVVIKLP